MKPQNLLKPLFVFLFVAGSVQNGQAQEEGRLNYRASIQGGYANDYYYSSNSPGSLWMTGASFMVFDENKRFGIGLSGAVRGKHTKFSLNKPPQMDSTESHLGRGAHLMLGYSFFPQETKFEFIGKLGLGLFRSENFFYFLYFGDSQGRFLRAYQSVVELDYSYKITPSISAGLSAGFGINIQQSTFNPGDPKPVERMVDFGYVGLNLGASYWF